MNDLPNHRTVPPGWLREADVARIARVHFHTIAIWRRAGWLHGERHRIASRVITLIPATEIERLRLDAVTINDTEGGILLDCTGQLVRKLEQFCWLTRLPTPPRSRPRYLRSEVVALSKRLDATGLPMPADCLTITEAADLIGVSTTTVRRLERRGLPLAGIVRFVRVYRRADCERIREEFPRRDITRAIARSIVVRALADETYRAIAADTGLTRERVKCIAAGKSWGWETHDLRTNRRAA